MGSAAHGSQWLEKERGENQTHTHTHTHTHNTHTHTHTHTHAHSEWMMQDKCQWEGFKKWVPSTSQLHTYAHAHVHTDRHIHIHTLRWWSKAPTSLHTYMYTHFWWMEQTLVIVNFNHFTYTYIHMFGGGNEDSTSRLQPFYTHTHIHTHTHTHTHTGWLERTLMSWLEQFYFFVHSFIYQKNLSSSIELCDSILFLLLKNYCEKKTSMLPSTFTWRKYYIVQVKKTHNCQEPIHN